MSEFELFFRNGSSDYGDGVVLNKHGDTYSIVTARESQNGGTVYKDWAFPQDKDRKPRAKAIPLGAKLGNRTQAIGILRAMLGALEKPASANNDPVPAKKDDSDMPPF